MRAGNQSLALFRAADAKYEAALIENNLANAYLALGNLTRAGELVNQAHREHDRAGDGRQLPAVLDTEARIRLAGGDVDEAVRLAERAVEAAQAVGNQGDQDSPRGCLNGPTYLPRVAITRRLSRSCAKPYAGDRRV